jgi:hypothetical protein
MRPSWISRSRRPPLSPAAGGACGWLGQAKLLRDSFKRCRHDGVENFLNRGIVDLGFRCADASGTTGVIDQLPRTAQCFGLPLFGGVELIPGDRHPNNDRRGQPRQYIIDPDIGPDNVALRRYHRTASKLVSKSVIFAVEGLSAIAISGSIGNAERRLRVRWSDAPGTVPISG